MIFSPLEHSYETVLVPGGRQIKARPWSPYCSSPRTMTKTNFLFPYRIDYGRTTPTQS